MCEVNTLNDSIDWAAWIQAIGTLLAAGFAFWSVKKLIVQNDFMRKMFELEASKLRNMIRPYFKNTNDTIYLTNTADAMRYNAILVNVGNGEGKNLEMIILDTNIDIKNFRMVTLRYHTDLKYYESINPTGCFKIYINFNNKNNLPDEQIKITMAFKFKDKEGNKYQQNFSISGRLFLPHTVELIEP